MTKELIIIALILALIYLYYQNKKLASLPADTYPKTIFEVSKDEGDYEDLVAEKDAAIRSKNEAEAELLSVSNQLRNKQSEVSRKEQEIERLKKEKSSSEIALNKKISEKNGLITTLQREINQQKEKYSKQGQQLDTEQLENNKLSEKVEELQEQITELTRPTSPLPGSFPEEVSVKQHKEIKGKKDAEPLLVAEYRDKLEKLVAVDKKLKEQSQVNQQTIIDLKKELETKEKEWGAEKTKLEQQIIQAPKEIEKKENSELKNKLAAASYQHIEQLRKINLLFDPNASNYETIEFNGLYELLKAKVKND